MSKWKQNLNKIQFKLKKTQISIDLTKQKNNNNQRNVYNI